MQNFSLISACCKVLVRKQWKLWQFEESHLGISNSTLIVMHWTCFVDRWPYMTHHLHGHGMSPKKVIRANAKKVKKYLVEGVQLLKLMERLNYTVVCADILQHYGVVIPYHTLHNCFLGFTCPYRHKPTDFSSSFSQRQSMFLSTGFIFTQTQPSHSLNRQFARRLNVSVAKSQVKDGFPAGASLLPHLEHNPTSSSSDSGTISTTPTFSVPSVQLSPLFPSWPFWSLCTPLVSYRLNHDNLSPSCTIHYWILS